MTGPLSSLKVIDFSNLLPGPYATMLLSGMGAEVLRIEAPNRVDLVKGLPPFGGKFSTAFSYLARGKNTLKLNLKQAGATNKIKELVKNYDIVIEQFRPGVVDPWSILGLLIVRKRSTLVIASSSDRMVLARRISRSSSASSRAWCSVRWWRISRFGLSRFSPSSLKVPDHSLAAFEDILQSSMANSSLPRRPCSWQTNNTCSATIRMTGLAASLTTGGWQSH